jgi:hypothetical protein
MPTLTHEKNLRVTAPQGRGLTANAPGAARINEEYKKANSKLQGARDQVLLVGFLLMEQRTALFGNRQNNQHTEDSDRWSIWLEKNCPEISVRTAYRWMDAAERSALAIGSGPIIEIDAQTMPFSSLLSMAEDELSVQGRELRQLWFDFIQDKTINDCLNAVIDGEKDPHAITRAHNGKHAKNAGGGGDRKNFVGFTGVALRKLTTFFSHKLTPAEQAKIVASTGAALEKWPKWLLEPLAEMAKKEAKLSDEERAARKGSK